ncbi:Hydantoinase B/oxoprolinase-domain-containing protein [Pavlovales sp. CCMP2436]|nr:Hydantoinase B/oxoprolinase-domain-containing protein [Pavlovales sp. CCMP2436]
MNNFTFGNEHFGYYETIAGGCGAGPGWHGTSGVQCHMTNTRITDVEVLERRFPVAVCSFSLRRGSGGAGEWRGGDGVVREVEILADGVTATLLTERRVLRPFGMRGGRAGAAGRNTLSRAASGDVLGLGGKNRVRCGKGDVIKIETPGGGGWGALLPGVVDEEDTAGVWADAASSTDASRSTGERRAQAGGALPSRLRGTPSVALSMPGGEGVEF